jgi:hypothetical protein
VTNWLAKTNLAHFSFARDFAVFRAKHKLGGILVLFLTNMGIWSLVGQISDDSILASFQFQLIMSLLFTTFYFPFSANHEQHPNE